jgi:transposase
MRYTREEREELAQRKEQWILRTEQGESPQRVGRELKLKASSLPRLRQQYQAGGRTWQVKAFLKKAKEQHPQATGAELCVQVWERFEIDISLRRLNELLHAEALSNSPGRPRKVPAPEPVSAPEREVDNAGVFFPSGGVERTGRSSCRAKRA